MAFQMNISIEHISVPLEEARKLIFAYTRPYTLTHRNNSYSEPAVAAKQI